MRSVAKAAIAVPIIPSIGEVFAEIWSQNSVRFCRFLNNLPDRVDDINPEVFKRVPVPV
jgi:hypothetical protein